MQKFFSNQKQQSLILFSSYAVTAIATSIFYFLQNNAQLLGGNIALAKVIWLAYTILIWFILPAILIAAPQTPNAWKSIYKIFLANMLFRAAFELLMIYVWLNWSTTYGIAHDVFSIALLSWLTLRNRDNLHEIFFSSITAVFLLMFVIEIIFVLYMTSTISEAGSSVYFVPDSSEHSQIIFFTWTVNFFITVYLYYFSRAWTHEKQT